MFAILFIYTKQYTNPELDMNKEEDMLINKEVIENGYSLCRSIFGAFSSKPYYINISKLIFEEENEYLSILDFKGDKSIVDTLKVVYDNEESLVVIEIPVLKANKTFETFTFASLRVTIYNDSNLKLNSCSYWFLAFNKKMKTW